MCNSVKGSKNSRNRGICAIVVAGFVGVCFNTNKPAKQSYQHLLEKYLAAIQVEKHTNSQPITNR